MNFYYANQAMSLPHFSVHYRQRRSGFGSRCKHWTFATPLARRFILPTMKRIGKQLLWKQFVPDILNVVCKKNISTHRAPKRSGQILFSRENDDC